MTSYSADPTEARERALRRELQRIHRAEVATARALEEIRAARSRVEELLAAAPTAGPSAEAAPEPRRQPESTTAPVAPAPPAAPAAPAAPGDAAAVGATPGAAAERDDEVRAAAADGGASSGPAPTRRRRGREAAVGVAVLVLVGFIGWWAFQNVPGDGADATTSPPVTDPGPPVADADDVPGRDAASGEAGGAGPGPGAEPGPFDDLPRGGEASIALLDSLWAGPSPLLEPLLAEVEETTGSSAVEEGIETLRSGEEPGVLVRDLVRSAALQLGLRRLTGEELSVDGQVLRNPCRGTSCGALLELWEDSASAWGLEPPGDDATRDLTGLAAAEAAAVLRVLRDLHGG